MAVDSFLEPPSLDRLDSFTDRERVMMHFQQMLRTAKAGEVHLLSIKGHSGTGKTFLIEYLTKRTCPQAGWRTGNFDFTQSLPDFRSILDGVEDTLKGCVPRQSLKQYRTEREEYKRRFDEYRAVVTVNQSVEANEASSISHIQQYAQIDVELRRRERQLRAELTRVLLELAEECEQSLCLFLDGYERLVEADLELVGWLWEDVLLKLVKNVPEPVLIITCGWEYPSSAALQPFSTRIELDDFDRLRITSYLQTQSIISPDASAHNNEALTELFYDLTQGHPFVLSLAASYYQTLPESERCAESLQAGQPLLDEEARVQWLDERLLNRNRLPEPFRTLLECGPILRTFDQATLQNFLQVGEEGKSGEALLDDRAYTQFLRYPFINRKNLQGDTLLEQPTFHDLTRRVRLQALRRWHPETIQKLNRAMAEYYSELTKTERQQFSLNQVISPYKPYIEWFAKIPQQKFRALLEFFYHALQVKEWQVVIFNQWYSLVSQALSGWRRNQAEQFIELVRQLAREGEPFLNKRTYYYGKHLIQYSWYLEQDARWDDARLMLQDALKVFEQGEHPSDQATCLNRIGSIYQEQGQFQQALDYYQRALSLQEQVGGPADVATSFNRIGSIYDQQGQLQQALDYYQHALSLVEHRVGNLTEISSSLNNIGFIYHRQGQFQQALYYYQRALSLIDMIGPTPIVSRIFRNIGSIYREQGQFQQALDYYQRALSLSEQHGNPTEIAHSLHGIGAIYYQRGQFQQALDYYQRALSFREQRSNPTDITTSLNNIGLIYYKQGQFQQALDYYQRVLSLQEQVGDPAVIATLLNNMGEVYREQGQFQQALDYYQRALSLQEQVGDPAAIATLLNNIGFIYHEQGQFQQALDYYQRARSLEEQIGNPVAIARCLYNISVIYYDQEQWQDAISFLSGAALLYERMGQGFELSRITALERLVVCYIKSGETDKGVLFYIIAEQLRAQLQKSQA